MYGPGVGGRNAGVGMTDSQKWLWLGGGVTAGWLLYLLAPILLPFLMGALFAYLGDPLVDRLEARKLSRTSAVVLVFSVMTLAMVILVLFPIPLLVRQLETLTQQLPRVVEWLQGSVLPSLGGLLGVDAEALWDTTQLKRSLAAHWREAGGLAAQLLDSISSSGLVLLGWLANLVLIPVVTFYLLRDWDRMLERLRHVLPRNWEPTLTGLARESDQVLGAFLRGQLLVMLALAVVYVGGLWLVGLKLALVIGLVAGLVSFVPYLGFIVGILVATVAAWLQFQELVPLLWVAAVFGIGQLLESMWLTPSLVGDRIGLHPVAVIFAIMAGGQLFGFVGVLMALPVASVVMVLLRHAHERYLNSELYERPSASAAPETE